METVAPFIIALSMVILFITGVMHFIPSDYHILGYMTIILVLIFSAYAMYYIGYGSWTNINDTHLGKQLMASDYTMIYPMGLIYNNDEYYLTESTNVLIDPDHPPSKRGFKLVVAPGLTFRIKHVYYVHQPLTGPSIKMIVELVSKPIITDGIETEYDANTRTFRWNQINNLDKYTNIASQSFNLYTHQFFTLDESGTLDRIGNQTPTVRNNLIQQVITAQSMSIS